MRALAIIIDATERDPRLPLRVTGGWWRTGLGVCGGLGVGGEDGGRRAEDGVGVLSRRWRLSRAFLLSLETGVVAGGRKL